jgi:hypothetical protein
VFSICGDGDADHACRVLGNEELRLAEIPHPQSLICACCDDVMIGRENDAGDAQAVTLECAEPVPRPEVEEDRSDCAGDQQRLVWRERQQSGGYFGEEDRLRTRVQIEAAHRRIGERGEQLSARRAVRQRVRLHR